MFLEYRLGIYRTKMKISDENKQRNLFFVLKK